MRRSAFSRGRPNATRVPPNTVSADRRHIFVTDAIMHGMPPHIAQLVAGHRDINVTMGYKAVYPEEVINGHRAFIARRCKDPIPGWWSSRSRQNNRPST